MSTDNEVKSTRELRTREMRLRVDVDTHKKLRRYIAKEELREGVRLTLPEAVMRLAKIGLNQNK